MAATVTLVQGTTWSVGDYVTAAKLNLTANPSASVTFVLKNADDVAGASPTDGQILVFVAATGKWTPQAIPVSTSDVFNQIFSWAYFS